MKHASPMEIGESLDDRMDLAFLPRSTRNGHRPHYLVVFISARFLLKITKNYDCDYGEGLGFLCSDDSCPWRGEVSFPFLLCSSSWHRQVFSFVFVTILEMRVWSIVHVLECPWSLGPLRSFCSFVFFIPPDQSTHSAASHRRKGVDMAWC